MKVNSPESKIAIVGAGVMGLICAYELLKKGYKSDQQGLK